MLQKQELLKAVTRPEEKLLLAKVLDQANFSLRKHEFSFTDFMDIGKCTRFLQIFNKTLALDLSICLFGGNDDCERKMFAFAPSYMEISNEDFPIDILKISKNKKFGQSDLSHRDYLGSILGLGIDRGKIGDIILFEDETICFVRQDISSYICTNLEKVSHTNVKIEIVDKKEIILHAKEYIEKNMTVASLRLDAVVAAMFNLSRGRALEFIQAEKVNVNWTMIHNPSFNAKEGDIISIRGLGRMKLLEIRGKTKKDRIGIVIGQPPM